MSGDRRAIGLAIDAVIGVTQDNIAIAIAVRLVIGAGFGELLAGNGSGS